MPIYTRGGDQGDTGLFGGPRVPKSHPRVSAYGAVDELNCQLGAARAALPAGPEWQDLDQALARVQSDCFTIGALLATPPDQAEKLGAAFDRDLPKTAMKRLEAEIDLWESELPPLKTFLLPGGTPAGAALHVARAVARRAERDAVALSTTDALPEGVLVYLNRLSSWLFDAARLANARQRKAETPWSGLKKG